MLHLKVWKKFENHGVRYELEVRDIIAIIDVRPKCIDDLEKPNRSYLVAIVLSMRYKRDLTILSSKPILFEHDKNKKRQTLYASLDKHDHKYSYMEGLEL